jgi:hypothetical protein
MGDGLVSLDLDAVCAATELEDKPAVNSQMYKRRLIKVPSTLEIASRKWTNWRVM